MHKLIMKKILHGFLGIEFFLKIGLSRPLFVYFHPFLITISIIQIHKSVDGVHGIWTCGRKMVGSDDTAEQWHAASEFNLLNNSPIKCVSSIALRLILDFVLNKSPLSLNAPFELPTHCRDQFQALQANLIYIVKSLWSVRR